MSGLTQKTLRTIVAQHIEPIPRWHSRVRNGAYWLGMFVLVVLAVFAAAISFHVAFEIDWDAYAKSSFAWWQILLSGVPFFSLLLLTLFLWGGITFLHQTRYGYRYAFSFLIVTFFGISSLVGYAMKWSALDEPVERLLLLTLPYSDQSATSWLPSAERQWSSPEQGLLGGTVLGSTSTDIKLLDTAQERWTVEYTDATKAADVTLEKDEEIKVIGTKEEGHTFRATEIKTWEKSPVQKAAAVERRQQTEAGDEHAREQDDNGEQNEERDKEQMIEGEG